MAAKDIFHHLVKTALEKEGWKITHDPYRLSLLGKEMQIDLGAEKILIAAEKDDLSTGSVSKIAVEVKSFINPSFTYDFHLALGQYLNYLVLMEEQEPERDLYLAVSQTVYDEHFQHIAVEKVIQRYQLKLLIFDDLTAYITLWKK